MTIFLLSSKALVDLNLTAVDKSLFGNFLPDLEMFEVPEYIDEYCREYTAFSRRNNSTDLFFLISSDNKALGCLLSGWCKLEIRSMMLLRGEHTFFQ